MSKRQRVARPRAGEVRDGARWVVAASRCARDRRGRPGGRRMRRRRRRRRRRRQRGCERRAGHAVVDGRPDRPVQLPAKALVSAFKAKNPNITIKIETGPQGSEGDNLVKTRLATGDMTDMFVYNSGSLLPGARAGAEPAADDRRAVGRRRSTRRSSRRCRRMARCTARRSAAPSAAASSTTARSTTGSAWRCRKTWDEFMANNAKIKAAGVDAGAPDLRRHVDLAALRPRRLSTTSPRAEPRLGREVHREPGQVLARSRRIEGFQQLRRSTRRLPEQGLRLDQVRGRALSMLAQGKGAHYPMLTVRVRQPRDVATRTRSTTSASSPLPGDDAAKNGLTSGCRPAVYIPKTTEGDKLDAAKKFLAFVASPEGCDVRSEAFAPTGPYVVKGCTLPADVPQAVKDMQPYVDGGKRHARRWSSCRPSRAPRWSRSPSRSAPASAGPRRRRRRSTTRTSRSRPSSSGSRAGRQTADDRLSAARHRAGGARHAGRGEAHVAELRNEAVTGRRIALRPPCGRGRRSPYPYWFYLPAFVIYFVFFLVPTFARSTTASPAGPCSTPSSSAWTTSSSSSRSRRSSRA